MGVFKLQPAYSLPEVLSKLKFDINKILRKKSSKGFTQLTISTHVTFCRGFLCVVLYADLMTLTAVE
jgi:hypothetical protein